MYQAARQFGRMRSTNRRRATLPKAEATHSDNSRRLGTHLPRQSLRTEPRKRHNAAVQLPKAGRNASWVPPAFPKNFALFKGWPSSKPYDQAIGTNAQREFPGRANLSLPSIPLKYQTPNVGAPAWTDVRPMVRFRSLEANKIGGSLSADLARRAACSKRKNSCKVCPAFGNAKKNPGNRPLWRPVWPGLHSFRPALLRTCEKSPLALFATSETRRRKG